MPTAQSSVAPPISTCCCGTAAMRAAARSKATPACSTCGVTTPKSAGADDWQQSVDGAISACNARRHTDAVVRRTTDRETVHRSNGGSDPLHPVEVTDGVL